MDLKKNKIFLCTAAQLGVFHYFINYFFSFPTLAGWDVFLKATTPFSCLSRTDFVFHGGEQVQLR